MADTGFSFSLSTAHVGRYTRIIQEWLTVRRHYDLFMWLQGEIQHYLPHEIMVAAWGNFSSNFICHDIVSALIAVRTEHSDVRSLSPLLEGLFNRWVELGRKPYTMGAGESGFLLEERGLQCSLGLALQGMQSILIHGIIDKRNQHDRLYIIFSRKQFRVSSVNTLEILLPYLDVALSRIDPLPCYKQSSLFLTKLEDYGLTACEIEIINRTRMGKSISEAADSLGISAFAVKNHLRNIFKKLHTYNRVQNESKTERTLPSDAGND